MWRCSRSGTLLCPDGGESGSRARKLSVRLQVACAWQLASEMGLGMCNADAAAIADADYAAAD